MRLWHYLRLSSYCGWLSIHMLLGSDLAAEELVKINLAGTLIDVLPVAIDVVSADPGAAARALEKKGGVRWSKTKESRHPIAIITHQHVDYVFGTPDHWNEGSVGYQFKPGDVVYVFLLDSEQAIRDFVKRYKLRKHAVIRTKYGVQTDLHIANPGYYVKFMVKRVSYTCSMHPEVLTDQPGNCPKCKMELVPIELSEEAVVPGRR